MSVRNHQVRRWLAFDCVWHKAKVNLLRAAVQVRNRLYAGTTTAKGDFQSMNSQLRRPYGVVVSFSPSSKSREFNPTVAILPLQVLD
jgi:hypothetical protein